MIDPVFWIPHHSLVFTFNLIFGVHQKKFKWPMQKIKKIKFSNSKHDLLLILSFHFRFCVFAVSSWWSHWHNRRGRNKNEMKNLNSLHIRGFENYESLMVPKNIPNYYLFFSREFPFSQNNHIVVDIMLCHIIPFLYLNTSLADRTHGHPLQEKTHSRLFPGYRIHKFRFYDCFFVVQ